MKIYILTDLEGPAMVFGFDQTRLPEAEARKPAAMALLTREVNAGVDGILDADPDAQVVVLDGHGSGGIASDLLHDRAELIAGHGLRSPWGLDASYGALFFVGQVLTPEVGRPPGRGPVDRRPSPVAADVVCRPRPYRARRRRGRDGAAARSPRGRIPSVCAASPC